MARASTTNGETHKDILMVKIRPSEKENLYQFISRRHEVLPSGKSMSAFARDAIIERMERIKAEEREARKAKAAAKVAA